MFQLLDQPEEAADIYEPVQLQGCRGQVEVQDVRFGYVPGKIILHDLNLKAELGQTVTIMGPTGCGKTTIINLLMRFYGPDSGCIRVDGKENRAYTMDSLRRSYAMVLQDTWLFQGTIYENIAYGKEGATREEVIAAAKAACIHNYIMRLPDGYDTVIREDGGNISKGQKQLLTIARAMRNLMRGKTCFVIAHRLSTVQNADKILVVDHGDVVEQGTHESLMEQKSFYYRLYASQFA